ncbi:hypothetical protein X943_000762 [Babesia divergens]|uniref:Uncharacterized protein n=1 Tax=Babesia divergens TaxID=32595 RepID=A0AAD9GG51_BABDI|nr:hypothetical protein X943_000762 [Babesia divergens]
MGSNTDFRTLQGGHWSNNNVNGSGSSGQNLKNWLTKEKTFGGGSSKPLTLGLIRRGFLDSELKNSNDGSTVAQELKKAVSLTPNTDYGSLQNVLCGLMFVCSWDASLLGHAICFLYKFCSKVSQGSEDLFPVPYKDHSGAFKEVCRGLKSDLQPFINGSSGLSAVSQGNQNLFDSLWDNEKISDYCTWLKVKLSDIVDSLEKMSSESSKWNRDLLQGAASAGPFKYGFVFKDGSWGDHTFKSHLPPEISPLIESGPGSLQSLQKSLENFSTGNPGATAGGVFTGLLGTGGLGAGVAYGFNLFGFKNLVTGLISSFLK